MVKTYTSAWVIGVAIVGGLLLLMLIILAVVLILKM